MNTETVTIRTNCLIKQMLRVLSEHEKRSLTKEVEFLINDRIEQLGLWSKVLKPQAEKP